MVNSKDFGKRIQKLMDHYGVSASSFADYMGVGRSSISHILSGRNKPSLDFVMKITEAYTDVDMQWLLYGKGTFPKSEKAVSQENISVPESISSPTLEPISTPNTDTDLFSQHKEEIKPDLQNIPSLAKIDTSSTAENRIDRIVIFYADGTFDSYQIKKT
ncbi:helix-turn-helix domain-containing protein [Aquimarina sp. AU474]|uniref:helix-turn-helix domain-containing protein n=1 Tax=Aquimarina sp. AU474 TaxID=2108529 RepID=UPI000D69006E|nr:helix-turn-helix transcriptional regulator [Aquimarina sp. AU474]